MSSAFAEGCKRRAIAKKNPSNSAFNMILFQLQRLQSRICDLLTVDPPSSRRKYIGNTRRKMSNDIEKQSLFYQ